MTRMDAPPTRYLGRAGGALAYQVVGSGHVDVVVYLEIIQHLDLLWSDPHTHYNLARGASYSRTAYFQRRGFGLSDPIDHVPSIEQQADDVLAVMDDVGMQRATLVGVNVTAGPVALVAARAPERVSGLVLITPIARGLDGTHVPVGWSAAEAEEYVAQTEDAITNWGSGGFATLWDPIVGATPYNRRLMGMLERCSASPATARAHYEWYRSLDLTDVYSSVRVPTRVVRQETSRLPDAVCRHVAELIPGAEYVTLPPTQPGASLGEAFATSMDQIEEVASGTSRPADADRALGTVLFTDVVGSTDLLARLGDGRYRGLRAAHERQVHLAVEEAGGRLVSVAGDGTLSVFDGPSQAIRCAEAVRDAASELGISVRAGVHTGEIELAGPEVVGLTVHIGARVSAAAGPDEILVSRTVRDLVAGSGRAFTDRGEHHLKGVPGSAWQLFALEGTSGDRIAVSPDPPTPTVADRFAVTAARRSPASLRTAMRLGNAVQRIRAGRGRS